MAGKVSIDHQFLQNGFLHAIPCYPAFLKMLAGRSLEPVPSNVKNDPGMYNAHVELPSVSEQEERNPENYAGFCVRVLLDA